MWMFVQQMLIMLIIFRIVLIESMYLLVCSRGWWALMVCPWSMGQQESTGRNIGQMEGLWPCPKSGLHPLRPRRRARPRLSPRDRSAMSTPTPSLFAGLHPPRIRTPWVRYPNTARMYWATEALQQEIHKQQNIWLSFKSIPVIFPIDWLHQRISQSDGDIWMFINAIQKHI